MSTRSKSKKAVKEQQKTPSKASGIANVLNEHANGYSPVLGKKFDTLDNRVLSSSLNSSGRDQDLEETYDQTVNILGTGQEYDSASNNDSWSGESEDTNKEKTPPHPTTHQELIPGADNDKREKIRQKNEKKHQRQKEKRAQELHDRCCGFLMSRKLETLSQQLVSMGFSSEKATMSLILNEGKIEESVAWLLESVEESSDKHVQSPDPTNLKMDISEELARISTLITKYNCSKQEVERAVVSCEGDLDKAVETLKIQKQNKIEATVDPQPNQSLPKTTTVQPKPVIMNETPPRKEEKDFNYTKSTIDSGNKAFVQVKSMTMKSTTTPKPETSLNHIKHGSIKEPVVVMQRPQSNNLKQVLNPNWIQQEMKMNPSFNNYNHSATSPLLAAASSLGLFSKLDPNPSQGSSPLVDWNTCGSMFDFDYNNIDWSLDRNLARSKFSTTGYYIYEQEPGLSMRPRGVTIGGEMGTREWSSPFEEMDLFSIPRQFVSSSPCKR